MYYIVDENDCIVDWAYSPVEAAIKAAQRNARVEHDEWAR